VVVHGASMPAWARSLADEVVGERLVVSEMTEGTYDS
jgi:hypothetical protein